MNNRKIYKQIYHIYHIEIKKTLKDYLVTAKDYISGIPRKTKVAIAAGAFLGAASFVSLPELNAEETYSKLNENNYRTEINIDNSTYIPQGLEKEVTMSKDSGDTQEKEKKTTFFVYGTLNSGLVTSQPCKPLEDNYIPGSAYMISPSEYDSSWSLGIGADYKILPNLGVFFDGGVSTWKKLIAKEDGYGVGSWIWEQSGYNDARIGPFQMDTDYYIDTTNLRIGAKYIIGDGKFQPWLGAGYGLYAWTATIGNKDLGKQYGQDSGLEGGFSFLGGIDLEIVDGIILRAFGDYGSPVANPKIENLFQDGWTFENTAGEHILGPYRLGVAVGIRS